MVLIGYKKCKPIDKNGIRLIGVFEIMDDAKICPNPEKNLKTARFRVNKCKLLRVENLNGQKIDYDEIESVSFTNHDPLIRFKKNEIIKIDDTLFEENENFFGKGILMFLDFKRASNYLIEYLDEGEVTQYRDDGTLYSIDTYYKTKKHGYSKLFYPNGQIKEETTYYYGSISGMQYFYNLSGEIIKKIDHSPKYNNYGSSRYT